MIIYYPRDKKGKEKLEKIQNKGLRLALGYRNSTPISVMTAEAKICKIEGRADLLTRTKVVSESWKKNRVEYE